MLRSALRVSLRGDRIATALLASDWPVEMSGIRCLGGKGDMGRTHHFSIGTWKLVDQTPMSGLQQMN